MKNRMISCFLLITLLVTGCGAGEEQMINGGGTPDYTEGTVDESVFEEKFYYEQFSEEEQLVYQEVYQGIVDCQKKITVHSNDGELVNRIVQAVLFDFPEIFWKDGSGKSAIYNDTYIVLELTYTYVDGQKDKRETEIKNEVAQIIGEASKQEGEYEKIKYIYEYLVEHVAYVEDSSDNQNIYSSIVNKESVCAGYAKANQLLLEQLGIPCIYVTGTATNRDGSDSHAWNIVKCDGKYYYVDVTWADSMKQDEAILYDYLCCDEQILNKTHVAEGNYDFPKCDSSELNYYRLNHMYYEKVERDKLLDEMYQSIDAKEESTTFKFSNADVYKEAKELIIDELMSIASQYLGEEYGLQEVQCGYEMLDELHRFIIYWKYE